MLGKFLVLFGFVVALLALLVLYALKVAHNFVYLRLRDKKQSGRFADFFNRNFSQKGDEKRWNEAFLALPLFYAISFEDESKGAHAILATIKKIHLAIYSVLIFALLLSVYASKAYPEGVF